MQATPFVIRQAFYTFESPPPLFANLLAIRDNILYTKRKDASMLIELWSVSPALLYNVAISVPFSWAVCKFRGLQCANAVISVGVLVCVYGKCIGAFISPALGCHLARCFSSVLYSRGLYSESLGHFTTDCTISISSVINVSSFFTYWAMWPAFQTSERVPTRSCSQTRYS